jgi:hypothetical protein
MILQILISVYFLQIQDTLVKVNLKEREQVECPNCSRKDIGKIGVNQYYCWNCFIELSIVKGRLSLHQVEEDGSLTSLDDLFEDQDLTYRESTS